MMIIRKVAGLLKRNNITTEELRAEVEQKMMLALIENGVYEKWEYSKNPRTCINHILTSGKVCLYSYYESHSPETFNGHIYINGIWSGTYRKDDGSLRTTGFIEGDEKKFYRYLIRALNLVPGVVDGYKENKIKGTEIAIQNLINKYQTVKSPLQTQF